MDAHALETVGNRGVLVRHEHPDDGVAFRVEADAARDDVAVCHKLADMPLVDGDDVIDALDLLLAGCGRARPRHQTKR